MKALFYPICPTAQYYSIESVFDRLGYARTHDPADDYDFAVLWHPDTWVQRQSVLEDIAHHKRVFNLRCRDISKRRVDTAFSKSFGYSLMIDPVTYHGRGIMKRNENSFPGDGGHFVDCPTRYRNDQYVYQKFIDTIANGRVIEYRVPVIVGVIPEVLILEKDLPTSWVKTAAYAITVADVSTLFSADECADILRFCHEIGLDIGELDVMRDPSDGRIYILDANKTPGGYNKVNPDRQAQALARAVQVCT